MYKQLNRKQHGEYKDTSFTRNVLMSIRGHQFKVAVPGMGWDSENSMVRDFGAV